MKILKKLLKIAKRVMLNIRREHIGAFAAQSSFFFIMSFFPMIFLVFTVLRVSKSGIESFTAIIYSIIPYAYKNVIEGIFEGLSLNPSSVISFSSLLTAWSAGKGFYALAEGFHSVLSVNEKRNYFILRIRGLFYSIAFAIIIAALFFIGVFGNNIQQSFIKLYPRYFDYINLISVIRMCFIIFVLFVILSLTYTFLPDWRSYQECGGRDIRRRFHFISAFAASICIYLYTVIFSLYANIFLEFSSIYGGINAFIAVMLWVYGSMYILILGFRLSIFLNMIYQKRACTIKPLSHK